MKILWPVALVVTVVTLLPACTIQVVEREPEPDVRPAPPLYQDRYVIREQVRRPPASRPTEVPDQRRREPEAPTTPPTANANADVWREAQARIAEAIHGGSSPTAGAAASPSDETTTWRETESPAESPTSTRPQREAIRDHAMAQRDAAEARRRQQREPASEPQPAPAEGNGNSAHSEPPIQRAEAVVESTPAPRVGVGHAPHPERTMPAAREQHAPSNVNANKKDEGSAPLPAVGAKLCKRIEGGDKKNRALLLRAKVVAVKGDQLQLKMLNAPAAEQANGRAQPEYQGKKLKKGSVFWDDPEGWSNNCR